MGDKDGLNIPLYGSRQPDPSDYSGIDKLKAFLKKYLVEIVVVSIFLLAIYALFIRQDTEEIIILQIEGLTEYICLETEEHRNSAEKHFKKIEEGLGLTYQSPPGFPHECPVKERERERGNR